MCKKNRKAQCISASVAASGADANQENEPEDPQTEDSDADEELHDYVDGVLPEALTSSYMVKSPLHKVAQLAAA